MEYILEKELKPEIFTDEYEYFFTFLNDRFEYAVEIWIKELEKKFNKKFKPIWILSSKQNDLFKKENFIVLNKKLQEIKQNLKKNNVVYLEDYEDTNKEFSESEFIQDLINKLIEKQERVFILGFTSSCLDIQNPKVKILGPSPKIATQFDDKIKHIKLFHFLDLPRNPTRIYQSIEDIKSNEKYPFYISASYTSGGHESGTIYSEGDLDIFYSKLRAINKKHPFLVADLITDIKLSPNVNAVVSDEKDTRIICITDQILRGNQYLGNIYPSKADDKEKQILIETTKKIGNHLAKQGFRGLFGLDFIIDSKGNVFVVDLNPRRQGGYLVNILMDLPKINIPELELKLALGEEIPNFNYQDFQVDYAWVHSKIKPYYREMSILNEFKHSNVFIPFKEIGELFECLFYPKSSLLIAGNAGYFIRTGKDREKLVHEMIRHIEEIISKDFKLYSSL
ncbi:MAG: ATP-grasp domain-containing protein [Patescibacteria group bacterium]